MTEHELLYATTLTSFRAFVSYFFLVTTGKPFIFESHHEEIIFALERLANGEIKRLIINVPPRYGKTELVVKLFVAWCLANNARAKFIHLSYSDDLALDNSSAIRDVVKSEEFQRLFPTPMKADSDSKKKWYTDINGGVYATAAGGAVTGFGAGSVSRTRDGTGSPADGFGGAIIIDDPLKPDDAFSNTLRNRVNRRFNNSIQSRTNSPDTPIILIMQRLHEDDMTGYLLGGGSGDEWTHLCFPAIRDDGTALWPAKHSIERLRLMESVDKYTFSGQYMQRPSPLGGGLIKGVWFGRYTSLPKLKYRKIYADTAQKTGERNDYSVFECWGLGEDGRIYLIDLIRGKWEAPELKRRAIAFWEKHISAFSGDRFAPPLRQMMVEDAASGTGLIQSIKESGNIPIKGIIRSKDKLTRVMDVVSYIESGLVCIPEKAEFTNDFIGECETFTPDDTHAHDDQIDPMCDSITDMLVTKKSIYDNL